MVAEIGWTHNLVILEKCKDDLEREFYLRMVHKFGWTKKVLPIRLFLDISDIQRSGYVEKIEEKGFCPTSEGDSVSIPERYLGISTSAALNCNLSPYI